jgi:uncharacterized protein YcnI
MNRKTMRLGLASAAAAATALVAPAIAAAHVTVQPGELTAGDYGALTFRVPHGCEDSPTTKLSIQIPDGFAGVTPQAVPGWDVKVKMGKLNPPIEQHGEKITEAAKEVTWTGGPLDPHEFTDFGLSLLAPDKPGETVYFKAIQTCEKGETAWIEVPAAGQSEHDLDEPAPAVKLVPAKEHGDAAASDEHVVDAEPAAATTSSESSNSDTLSIVALIVGAVGLVAGVIALIAVRRRTA